MQKRQKVGRMENNKKRDEQERNISSLILQASLFAFSGGLRKRRAKEIKNAYINYRAFIISYVLFFETFRIIFLLLQNWISHTFVFSFA